MNDQKKLENPGVLGEAYFVGRRALLQWINELLETKYTKVEQMADGVAYCQLMDAIFPGKFPMTKVVFNPKNDLDWIRNFRLLQKLFDQQNVSKPIPVQKLIKAKYQDNLEFMQWMKNFFDLRHNGNPYPAKLRRDAAIRKQKGRSKMSPAKPRLRTSTRKPEAKSAHSPSKSIGSTPTKTAKPAASSKRTSGSSGSSAQVQKLKSEITKLTDHIGVVEKERDFYYSKLREVEVLLQDKEGEKVDAQAILDVLYKTDDADFETPVQEAVPENQDEVVEKPLESAESIPEERLDETQEVEANEEQYDEEY